jgi:hypothetical protein
MQFVCIVYESETDTLFFFWGVIGQYIPQALKMLNSLDSESLIYCHSENHQFVLLICVNNYNLK